MSAPRSVVGFIDLDCFYVAVERENDPTLKNIPCAVIQYNAQAKVTATVLISDDRRVPDAKLASMGSIIAVSYEARRRGVTRQMRGNVARSHCPELQLVQVHNPHRNPKPLGVVTHGAFGGV